MRPRVIARVIVSGSLLAGWAACLQERSPSSATPVAEAGSAEAKSARRPLRVLFVGNSHTYINDVPKLVSQLAAAADLRRPLDYEQATESGVGLAEHVAAGRVQAQLRRQRWDYVVLQEQQQRQALTYDPVRLEAEFFAPARELDRLIRASGATTVLYMTWARREGDPENVPGDSYIQMHDRTRLAQLTLAKQLGARVAPVGEAWRWALDQRPDLPLWEPDGSHASLRGSYLAACVLYATLFGQGPLDNAYLADLPPNDAELLQRAARVIGSSW